MSFPNRLRSGASLAAAVALLLANASAHASDRVRVHPELSVSYEARSNVLLESEGERSDQLWRIDPSLRLESRGPSGHSELGFGARTRTHREFDDLDAVDPFARLSVERSLRDRLVLYARGSFERFTDRDPVEDEGALLEHGRPDLDRGLAEAGVRYVLSATSELSLSYAWAARDYDATRFTEELGDRYRDLDSGLWSLGFSRLLSGRDQITLQASLRDTDFDASAFERPFLATVFFDFGPIVFPITLRGEAEVGLGGERDRGAALTVGWTRAWSPLWSTALRGGVRRLHSRGNGFENVVFFAPSGTTDLALDERSTAFTGGFTLARRGQRSSLEISYELETRPSGGHSGSVDAGLLRLAYRNRLSERVSLRLGWELGGQRSASEFTDFALLPSGLGAIDLCTASGQLYGEWHTGQIDPTQGGELVVPVCTRHAESGIDDRYQRARLQLDWQMRRGFSTFLRYSFVDRDSDGRIGRSHSDHRLQLGFRYTFGIDVPSEL